MVGKTKFEVDNPAEALRDREGIFKVTSPDGYIFRVNCRKGRNTRVREIRSPQDESLSAVAHHDRFEGPTYASATRRWQIEKIA